MTSSAARYFSSITQEHSSPLGDLKLTRVVARANELRDRLGIPQQWVEAHYDEASRRFPRMDREQSPWAEFTYCQAVLQAWVHEGTKKVNPDKRRQRTAEEWEEVLRFFDKEFGITHSDSVYRVKGKVFSRLQGVIRAATNVNIYMADQRDVATHTTDLLFKFLCLEELLEKENNSNSNQRFFRNELRKSFYEIALWHDSDEAVFGEPTGRVASEAFKNGEQSAPPPISLHASLGWNLLRFYNDNCDQNVTIYIEEIARKSMKAMDDYNHYTSNLRAALSELGINGKSEFISSLKIKRLEKIIDNTVVDSKEGIAAALTKWIDRIAGGKEVAINPITGVRVPAAKYIFYPIQDGSDFLSWASKQNDIKPRHLARYYAIFGGERLQRNMLPDQHSELPNPIILRPKKSIIPPKYEIDPAVALFHWLGLNREPQFIDTLQKLALENMTIAIHDGHTRRKNALNQQVDSHQRSWGALGLWLDIGARYAAPALQFTGGMMIAGSVAGITPPATADLGYRIAAGGSLLAQWSMLQVGALNRLPVACIAVAANVGTLWPMINGGQAATAEQLPWLIAANTVFAASYYANLSGKPNDNSTKVEIDRTAPIRFLQNALIELGWIGKRGFKAVEKLKEDLPQTWKDFRFVANGGDLTPATIKKKVASLHQTARVNLVTQTIPIAAIPLLFSHNPATETAFWVANIPPAATRFIDGTKSNNVWWQASGAFGVVANGSLAVGAAIAPVNHQLAAGAKALGTAFLYLSFAAFSVGTTELTKQR